MANIYRRAFRVIVWLGDEIEGTWSAFEAIRLRSSSFEGTPVPYALLELLHRPWFRRVWVLQEVAAARRLWITCGSQGIDGYSFCLGLKALQPMYNTLPEFNLVPCITFLVRQDNAVAPLGQLLDMYHTHEATKRHDKIFALLGMRTDNLETEELEPDYDLPWSQLYCRVLRTILHNEIDVKTWDNSEVAMIQCRLRILGEIESVSQYSGWGDEQRLIMKSKSFKTNPSDGYIEWTASYALRSSAKSIQAGDFLALLDGCKNPTILRKSKDSLSIIMISGAVPMGIRDPEGDSISWSEVIEQAHYVSRPVTLIWDWTGLVKSV
ncbi:hypothetical protein BU23DRAFT_661806 [Bimuria novae-zelandiae CBS 107.79]|uniref:Heterokaryon incompatibility domain-containing protein n=1 Tax=Bimuria novae-zelandiae CBS 107.79 TaxID=1447943 RepID=A0A6A5US49_9PLEO|nr:hypothetical protein BU23DRAFT_661806 [Bimuria novae-zelandiae CBS 107.79]